MRLGMRRWQNPAASTVRRRIGLKFGGRDDTFELMDTVDAHIAAAEARTDTKFEKLLGELKLIGQRMEHVEKTTSGLRLNTWLAAATAVAIVAAIIAWGSSMFGVGMNVETAANKAAGNVMQSAQPQIDALNLRYSEMNGKLDQLIEAVQARPAP